MRVQTGTTATASILLVIGHKCSSCGQDNLSEHTLKTSAHTPTVLGINVNNNIGVQANQALTKELNGFNNHNDPNRYNKANFRCYCSACGHREPWARMNYALLDVISYIFLFVLIVAAFYIHSKVSSYNPFPTKGLAVFVAAAILYAGTLLCKRLDIRKKVKQIQLLPYSSLPTINIYNHKTGQVVPLFPNQDQDKRSV